MNNKQLLAALENAIQQDYAIRCVFRELAKTILDRVYKAIDSAFKNDAFVYDGITYKYHGAYAFVNLPWRRPVFLSADFGNDNDVDITLAFYAATTRTGEAVPEAIAEFISQFKTHFDEGDPVVIELAFDPIPWVEFQQRIPIGEILTDDFSITISDYAQGYENYLDELQKMYEDLNNPLEP
jgi:hypothetical protein